MLPATNDDYRHPESQGLSKGTPVFGSGFEADVCVNTPQTFTVDCSGTGEPPETVALLTPDGEKVIKRMCCLIVSGVLCHFKEVFLLSV